MRNRLNEKMIGEMYNFYRKAHRKEPPIWQIEEWNKMWPSRLAVEHEKLREAAHAKEIQL